MKKLMLLPFLLLIVWLVSGIVVQGNTPLPPSEDANRPSANDKLSDIEDAAPGLGDSTLTLKTPTC